MAPSACWLEYPGQTAGALIDALVSQVDIMPTVLDALGIPAPEVAFQGVSLAQPIPDRYVIGEGYPVPRFARHRYTGQHAAIRPNWKLVAGPNGAPELYDLQADPQERHNVGSSRDAAARDLNADLTA